MELDYVAPSTPIEEKLVEIWKQVLGLQKVGIHDNFFELGGDSILTIRVVSLAQQAGLTLNIKMIFKYSSISLLSSSLIQEIKNNAVISTTSTIMNPITFDYLYPTNLITTNNIKNGKKSINNVFSLTPNEKYFFNQHLKEPYHFVHSIIFKINVKKQKLSPFQFKFIFQQLILHHEVMRSYFFFSKENICKHVIEKEENAVKYVPFQYIYLQNILKQINKNNNKYSSSLLIKTETKKLMRSLDLSKGPLLRATLFDYEFNKHNYLFIVAHYLIMDVVSWQIILEDFQSVYEQITLQKTKIIRFPFKTTSIKNWTTKLMTYSQFSETSQQKIKYWTSMFTSSIITLNVPLDDISGEINNTVESCNEITVEFSKRATNILYQKISKIYQIQISEILLTALLLAFIKWRSEDSLLIYFKNHSKFFLFFFFFSSFFFFKKKY